MPKLVVSFCTGELEAARRIFERTFAGVRMDADQEGSRVSVHYTFMDNTHLLAARSWVADAIGCGLIEMGAAQEV